MKVIIDDCLLACFEEGREYYVQWDSDDNPFILTEPKDGSLADKYSIDDLVYHHIKFTVK